MRLFRKTRHSSGDFSWASGSYARIAVVPAYVIMRSGCSVHSGRVRSAHTPRSSELYALPGQQRYPTEFPLVAGHLSPVRVLDAAHLFDQHVAEKLKTFVPNRVFIRLDQPDLRDSNSGIIGLAGVRRRYLDTRIRIGVEVTPRNKQRMF